MKEDATSWRIRPPCLFQWFGPLVLVMVMRGVGWKGIDDVLFHRKKTTIPAQPLLEVKITKVELYRCSPAAVMNYLWKICAGRRRGRPLSVDFSVTAEWLDLLRVAERLVCNHGCVGWLPNDERVTKNRAFRVKIMDQSVFWFLPLSFSLLPTVGCRKILKDPNLTVVTAIFGDLWRKFPANGYPFHVRWYRILFRFTLSRLTIPRGERLSSPQKGKAKRRRTSAALHFRFVAVQWDTNSYAEALVKHQPCRHGNLPLSHRHLFLGHLTNLVVRYQPN